jgi:hypothetical protein
MGLGPNPGGRQDLPWEGGVWIDMNLINNRAGGNAPLIARRIAEEFLRENP